MTNQHPFKISIILPFSSVPRPIATSQSMGCGGSKDEVAAGNTIPAKSLRLNKSCSPNTSAIKSEEKPSLPPVDSAASETKEAAALISKDSPDRYFSSRKDDEAIAGGNIPSKNDDQLLVDSVSGVEDSSVVTKEVVIAIDGEAKLIAEGPKSQDGKTRAEDGEDSKEKAAASTEEKGSEETVAKEKLEVK